VGLSSERRGAGIVPSERIGRVFGSHPNDGRALSGAAPPGTYNISVTATNDCVESTSSVATIHIPSHGPCPSIAPIGSIAITRHRKG
jgi:hypothetical protein